MKAFIRDSSKFAGLRTSPLEAWNSKALELVRTECERIWSWREKAGRCSVILSVLELVCGLYRGLWSPCLANREGSCSGGGGGGYGARGEVGKWTKKIDHCSKNSLDTMPIQSRAAVGTVTTVSLCKSISRRHGMHKSLWKRPLFSRTLGYSFFSVFG